ncbi:MAG: Hpt domain-containing protein [Planctomycetota bacterium]
MPDMPARKPVLPLISEFAGDPEMAELVESFASDLPSRIDAIIAAIKSQSVTDLKRLAHQLKGSAGGYGFQTLGASACKVEQGLAKSTAPANEAIAAVDKDVRALVDLCYRASLTAPGAAPNRPTW